MTRRLLVQALQRFRSSPDGPFAVQRLSCNALGGSMGARQSSILCAWPPTAGAECRFEPVLQPSAGAHRRWPATVSTAHRVAVMLCGSASPASALAHSALSSRRAILTPDLDPWRHSSADLRRLSLPVAMVLPLREQQHPQGAPSLPLAGAAFSTAARSGAAAGHDMHAGSSTSKLPDFIGTAVNLEGVINKVVYRGSRGLALLLVQVQPSTWRQLMPLVTHQGLPAIRPSLASSSSGGKGMFRPDLLQHKQRQTRLKNRLLSVRGFGMGSVGEGSMVRLSGHWRFNDKHGLEIECTSCVELPPSDPEALKTKLAHMVEHVGPVTAGQLVDKFGLDVERMLASPDAVQCMRAAGISLGKALKIKKAYDLLTGEQNMEVWLQDLGLPDAIVKMATERWPLDVLRAKFRDDPYATLMQLPLFDFPRTDLVAFKLGCSPDHPSRGPAAMLHALMEDSANRGHTFTPFYHLKATTRKVLEKADREWADWEAETKRADAGSPVPDAAAAAALHLVAASGPGSSPAPAPATDTAVALSRSATPAPVLATRTLQMADEWATRLMEMRRMTLEVMEDVHHGPVVLPPSLRRFALGLQQQQDRHGGRLAGADRASSPLPGGGVSPAPEWPADAQQQQVLLRHTRWPEHAMAYLEPLQSAERTVSSCLAGLLARTPRHLLRQLPKQQLLEQACWKAQVTPAVPGAPAAGMGASSSGPSGANPAPPTGRGAAGVAEAASGGEVSGVDEEREKVMQERIWHARQALRSEGNVELTDKQVEAVHMAAEAPVMLLTGAAGCGKTFTTKAIISVLRQQGKVIALCAPTGRAAQRLQEAGSDFDLSASTIHRLLKYKRFKSSGPSASEKAAAEDDAHQSAEAMKDKAASAGEDEGDAVAQAEANKRRRELMQVDSLHEDLFVYNSSNPLPAHVVVVDEASMLDIQVAAALMRALRPDAQLVLIGDPNQLPPVAAGSVLHDMIESGLFPQVHLDKIFRQSRGSHIVAGAHKVIHGQSPIQPTAYPEPPPSGHDHEDEGYCDPFLQPPPPRPAPPQPAASAVSTCGGGDSTSPFAADSAPQGMPFMTVDELLMRMRGDGPARLQTLGQGSNGMAPHSAEEWLAHHKRQASPVSPLMPKVADEEDEVDEGDGGKTSASHRALQRLRGLLGSDGVVVLEQSGDGVQAAHMVAHLVQALAEAGVDVSADVQVITPTKDPQQHTGINALNRLLQPIMNPLLRSKAAYVVPASWRSQGSAGMAPAPLHALHAGSTYHGPPFQEGDRVVQVENNYDTEVFNGDLGMVVNYSAKQQSIEVRFAPRPGSDGQYHPVQYQGLEHYQLQLAWATTVHKAQGAEYPVVIMVLHDSIAKSLQQRKLLYTAITRGRQLLLLVTSHQALTHAASHNSDKPRRTLLAARTLDSLLTLRWQHHQQQQLEREGDLAAAGEGGRQAHSAGWVGGVVAAVAPVGGLLGLLVPTSRPALLQLPYPAVALPITPKSTPLGPALQRQRGQRTVAVVGPRASGSTAVAVAGPRASGSTTVAVAAATSGGAYVAPPRSSTRILQVVHSGAGAGSQAAGAEAGTSVDARGPGVDTGAGSSPVASTWSGGEAGRPAQTPALPPAPAGLLTDAGRHKAPAPAPRPSTPSSADGGVGLRAWSASPALAAQGVGGATLRVTAPPAVPLAPTGPLRRRRAARQAATASSPASYSPAPPQFQPRSAAASAAPANVFAAAAGSLFVPPAGMARSGAGTGMLAVKGAGVTAFPSLGPDVAAVPAGSASMQASLGTL